MRDEIQISLKFMKVKLGRLQQKPASKVSEGTKHIIDTTDKK